MITSEYEYFEELEIEHDFRTYYANGYVEFTTTACIGSNYEGYDYEILYQREIYDISISRLWYNDEETDDGVDILHQYMYKEIEEIAEEEIRYRYE